MRATMDRSLFRPALALAALLLAPACDLRTAYFVRDTEGWSYRVACTANQCSPEVQSPHAPAPAIQCAPGAKPGFALAGQRVVVACHACVGGGAPQVDPARCRVVQCENDRDCPPHHYGATTQCVRGLCEVPSQTELDLPAAAGLCLMGAGDSGSAPASQVTDRMALARAACEGERCRAPDGCRAP